MRVTTNDGRRSRLALWVLAALAFGAANEVRAGDALIAVATNFADAMPVLETAFERRTEHELRFTTGSTGRLYAQIRKQAPFDVFLAADQRRAQRLIDEGRAVAGSRFTYARGRLVLWSRDADRLGTDGAATLRESPPRVLALANPALAPYGAAGRQTLEALGLWSELEPRVAMAQNVGQAYAMTATGAADMGFVPLSALVSRDRSSAGSHWRVPAKLHEPIRQDAVLLARAKDNPAARAFVEFLASPTGRGIIADHGYEME